MASIHTARRLEDLEKNYLQLIDHSALQSGNDKDKLPVLGLRITTAGSTNTSSPTNVLASTITNENTSNSNTYITMFKKNRLTDAIRITGYASTSADAVAGKGGYTQVTGSAGVISISSWQWVTHLYLNQGSTNAHQATNNANTYLKLYDTGRNSGTATTDTPNAREGIQITGSGFTQVTGASAKMTIESKQWQTKLYLCQSGGKASEATTNTTTYLKLFDEGANSGTDTANNQNQRASIQIQGSDMTGVSGSATGKLTITSHQWETQLFLTTSTGTAAAATANTTTYLRLFDYGYNSGVATALTQNARQSIQITGTGYTTVSGANNKLTVNTSVPNATTSIVGLVKAGNGIQVLTDGTIKYIGNQEPGTTITSKGNEVIEKDLTVKGNVNLRLSGSAYLISTGTSDVYIRGNTNIYNPTSISSTLSVTGNTSVGGTLTTAGATTLKSTLGVTGTTTLTGALAANGAATFGSTITANGTAQFNKAVTVGTSSANANLTVNGNINCKALTASGAITGNSTLTVAGTTNLNGTTNTKNVAVTGTLSTTGLATLNSLTVAGTTNLNGTTNTKNIHTVGSIDISNNLTVEGVTALRSTLEVSGTLYADTSVITPQLSVKSGTSHYLDVSSSSINSYVPFTQSAQATFNAVTIQGDTVVSGGFRYTNPNRSANFTMIYIEKDASFFGKTHVYDTFTVGGGSTAATKTVDSTFNGNVTITGTLDAKKMTSPVATSSVLGLVKIGTNIKVSSGTISVATATTSTLGLVKVGTNINVSSGTISVATATSSTLGLVKIGTNIKVSSGTISVATATSSTLGLVKIGSGITVNSGTISVPEATTSKAGLLSVLDKKKIDAMWTQFGGTTSGTNVSIPSTNNISNIVSNGKANIQKLIDNLKATLDRLNSTFTSSIWGSPTSSTVGGTSDPFGKMTHYGPPSSTSAIFDGSGHLRFPSGDTFWLG